MPLESLQLHRSTHTSYLYHLLKIYSAAPQNPLSTAKTAHSTDATQGVKTY